MHLESHTDRAHTCQPGLSLQALQSSAAQFIVGSHLHLQTAVALVRACCVDCCGMVAVVHCLCISTLYVASLYIWRVPASRQHPDTIKARMKGVLMTCCVAWLPAWHMHRQVGPA
jgi:hypothetical protein